MKDRVLRSSGIALVALLLLMWELSVRAGWVQSNNWPALSAVLVTLWEGLRSGAWFEVFGGSLLRMSTGYVLACVIGIALGALMASLPLVNRLLTPVVELLKPLPVVAIVPPLIFLLGVDDLLKVVVIAFACLFPILTSARAGVLAVDPVHLQVARTFGVPFSRRLLRIQIPSAMPYILAGMRTSLGLALIVVVIAEMIAGSVGIGYYVVSMQYAMRAADMYAAIIILAVLGYGLNRVFLAVESRLIRWSRLNQTSDPS